MKIRIFSAVGNPDPEVSLPTCRPRNMNQCRTTIQSTKAWKEIQIKNIYVICMCPAADILQHHE